MSFCWGWGGGRNWWSNCEVQLEFKTGRIFASIVGSDLQVCRDQVVGMRCSAWYSTWVLLEIDKFSFGWDK